MTDLDRLKNAFDKMGLDYHTVPALSVSNEYADAPVSVGPIGTLLTIEDPVFPNVGFVFDKDGKYERS